MHSRNLNRITEELQTGQRTVPSHETKYKSFDATVDVKTNTITNTTQAGDTNIPITSDATNDWRNFQIPGQ
jgi:hypothetical protein